MERVVVQRSVCDTVVWTWSALCTAECVPRSIHGSEAVLFNMERVVAQRIVYINVCMIAMYL
eukprot:10138424-Lingulodinium_polyedra.AAC.1